MQWHRFGPSLRKMPSAQGSSNAQGEVESQPLLNKSQEDVEQGSGPLSAPATQDVCEHSTAAAGPLSACSAHPNPSDGGWFKTCRICLEGQEDPDNPLISPCRCTGTSRYVHRECLDKWRAVKAGSVQHYRCEVCHFNYQFRRLWWAQLLRHPTTSYVVFTLLLLAVASVLGFVPILQALTQLKEPALLLHFANGMLLVGLVGFGFMVAEQCSGGSRPALLPGECPIFCGDCAGFAAGGGECAVCCMGVLAVVAVMGLLYTFAYGFGAMYRFVHSQVGSLQEMVENIGEPSSPRGRGGAAGGGGGTGVYSALPQSLPKRWWQRG